MKSTERVERQNQRRRAKKIRRANRKAAFEARGAPCQLTSKGSGYHQYRMRQIAARAAKVKAAREEKAKKEVQR
jgi:hypothetical protein